MFFNLIRMDDPSITYEQVISLNYDIPGVPENMVFKGVIFNRKRCPYGTLSVSYTRAVTAIVIHPRRGESIKTQPLINRPDAEFG